VNKPQFPSRSPRHDGLPRPSLRSLLAMTNTYAPTPPLSSRAPCGRGDPLVLTTRTDKPVRVFRGTMDCRVVHTVLLAMTNTYAPTPLLSSRGRSPWRSTGPNYPNRQTRPRPSLHSLLAMTKCELQSLHSLHGKSTTLVIASPLRAWRSTDPN